MSPCASGKSGRRLHNARRRCMWPDSMNDSRLEACDAIKDVFMSFCRLRLHVYVNAKRMTVSTPPPHAHEHVNVHIYAHVCLRTRCRAVDRYTMLAIETETRLDACAPPGSCEETYSGKGTPNMWHARKAKDNYNPRQRCL